MTMRAVGGVNVPCAWRLRASRAWARRFRTPSPRNSHFPDRVCIALTGDGPMQMNGLSVLITVAKYWKEWSDPRWICLVLNNRDLNQVTWEQRIMAGDIKFEASQDIPDFPNARYADSLGLTGIRVDHPEELADAWDRAFSADRPVVFGAITDPDVPTLPPHITLQQAKNFTESLLTGDPDEGGIIKRAVKGMVDSSLPHKDWASGRTAFRRCAQRLQSAAPVGRLFPQLPVHLVEPRSAASADSANLSLRRSVAHRQAGGF